MTSFAWGAERTGGWVDRWLDGRVAGRTVGWTDGWMHGQLAGRTGGWTDRWKLILMPCLALTNQLKLSSDQLNLSAGARFGKKQNKIQR